jgi:hypothetical protein
MRIHSEAAWGVASKFSHILASETRDLTAHIDIVLAAERERCAKIAEDWLSTFGQYKPEHIGAQTWANDAVRDIAEAIRKPSSP